MDVYSKNLMGLDKNYNTIKDNLFNKSLSNSLIFYGNKGVGKATFFYKIVDDYFKKFDLNPNNNNTTLIYNNSHPNVLRIEKEYDDKSKKIKNNISIDQIRNLHPFIRKSSINNLYKFIIIDSADDFNKNSANGLLKLLEEPNKDTYIFLICHQISKVLPTIRSRCIKFNFISPKYENFKDIILNFDPAIENNNIDFLFDISSGSPGLAIELYSNNILDFFYLLLEIFNEKKSLSGNILDLSNNTSKYNNDQFKIFISVIKFILVNIIKINLGINIKENLISNISSSLLETSKSIDNNISLKVLNYLDNNENDLLIYNLDKRIFTLNMFSSLSNL